MNYIAEVNSFYNWIMFNPLPTDAQALWHFLMQMNNRCAVKIKNEWYWRVEFTVPNQTIVSILAFSRQQLDRMRNVLIQTGRIVYKKGKGSQSGIYKIIPFDDSLIDNYVDNFPDKVWISLVSHNVTQTVTQPDTQIGHKPLHKPDTNGNLCNIFSTLTNSNNNINNIYNNSFDGDDDTTRTPAQTERLSDYLSELNNYFGITEAIKHEVTQFTKKLFSKYTSRQPTEHDIIQVFDIIMNNKADNGVWRLWLDKDKKKLLEYAFMQASDSGTRTWAYIRGVLDNLRARGLSNYDECLSYDAQRDYDRDRRNKTL